MLRLVILLIFLSFPAMAEPIRLTVALDESADFRSIQAAINSLPNNGQQAIIQLAPGLYQEKLYFTRDKVALMGSGREQTIIKIAELRSNWLKQHPNDWGSAVVNIRASDIALLRLTVQNSYGELTGDNEHQFAIRGFESATRIITDDCAVIAGGADTLSLWNKTDGMYYHRNCYFEGHTDMVCPRGWAFFTNSTFVNKKAYATLWHDGERAESQKLVVRDSHFDGVSGFMLGRRHYDAQFYLINNSYSQNMADKPIFRHTYPNQPERDRANLWGDRNYFSHDNENNAIYPWLKTNLSQHPQSMIATQITARWTFEQRWDPEAELKQLYLLMEQK
ncbi:MAG: pectinesterase family protein [Paraglaciecola sp.]|uniref:pectinesterase family protein n=1 Tax=Alishewanella sp. SMS8 TaxID=2994676 RepID=UPI0027425261|nr:pectinesterase family protein [Alishewanella sp. SMS8]MDP5131130.1 pectinesterase family protein [Paraglaciecola sp.]MDP5207186.1 pectinesterase family protein [Alishewanella sp. SMS9]MDP5458507.1 pectinesterase family protein [Alishewanella sp. SMS8]